MSKTLVENTNEFGSEEEILAALDYTGKQESNSGRKCVALDQLHIIREYIDKENTEQDNNVGVSGSVTDETGVFGLRFYNNKLQYKGTDGTWNDIVVSGNSEEGECTLHNIAKDEEVSDIFGV